MTHRSASPALLAGELELATEVIRDTPLHKQMGLTVAHYETDRIVVMMEMSESTRGSEEGTVHGGILATFADAASAFSLTGAFEPGKEIPVTTDLHVRYYRQPQPGPLTAEATVVHRGRRLLSTECVVSDAKQRVLARSTATYMIVPAGG